jgi:hypothetical protein
VEARLPAPSQAGTGVHPDSYTMGTGALPEVKRSRRGTDHPQSLKKE